jgi:nicotinamidase-related amidase
MTQRRALVLVDPLNEFFHPDGKLYSLLKESLDTTNTFANIQHLLEGTRAARIPVYYGLHQINKDGTYAGWLHMRSNHIRNRDKGVFVGWGAEIVEGLGPNVDNGDVVVSRHWNSSSFKNTDLDYQLRQREITHLTLAGMVANTCLEATAREATELGYRVTILSDCTAGFSNKLKEAGELVWPTLFEEVTTSKQWLASLNEEIKAKV